MTSLPQPQPPPLPLHKLRESQNPEHALIHKPGDFFHPRPPHTAHGKEAGASENEALWARPVESTARMSETSRRENVRVAQALRALDYASKAQSARAAIETREERSRMPEQQFDSLFSEINDMLGHHYGNPQSSGLQTQTASLPPANPVPKKRAFSFSTPNFDIPQISIKLSINMRLILNATATPPTSSIQATVKHFSVRSPVNEGMYSIYGGNQSGSQKQSSQNIYDKIQKYRANPDERKQLKERVDRYAEERKEKERRQTRFKNFRELNKYSIYYMAPSIHETEIKARAQEREEHAQKVAESRKDLELASLRRKMMKIDMKNPATERFDKRTPTPPITPRVKSSTPRDAHSSNSNQSGSLSGHQRRLISRSKSTPASAQSLS